MIGLRQCSFSGIVPAPTRPGGCAAANIGRRLYAEEEEEPRDLSREGRGRLEGLITGGHAPARQLTHVRILLKADEGEDAPDEAWPDTKIADALEVSRSTVARKIVLVRDNLNTHTPAALYEAFEPVEARRLYEKLEIHYTPKHGS